MYGTATHSYAGPSIVRRLGSDKYRYADSTGEITVKTDAKIWPAGTPAEDQTGARVPGAYDTSLAGGPGVEVARIEKLP